MSPNTAVLIADPVLAIGLLLMGVFIGLTIARVRSRIRRHTWRRREARHWNRGAGSLGSLRQPTAPRVELPPSRPTDSADQLRVVMSADFAIQPLLNKSEGRVLKELERFVEDFNPRWQVMAQVSLGEILSCKDASAYACINSKRVDLLLIDDQFLPRHAIEYQGFGHYQGSAAARDAIKKEALRRAGIGYHEVVAGQTTPSELRRLVERLVIRPLPQIMPGPVPPASQLPQLDQTPSAGSRAPEAD
ncbi:DUF2726 domain-containing protein [Rhodovarius crocodyli]|uniref:DUF2726 domain-containing protein n=1 Tax=Rhodovarius crocodyli TaxID=1979269 RepID=A0A437M215_9PROT|nr:DUF2726 domain-containing protein [Rhodovarius crocodyli]RVT91626.1 DUF2726 domain-containing protein [Rhodovarius crocodyli]